MANSPYILPAGNPPLPSGEFLLPVCTNRERAGELLNALNFYLVHSGDESFNAVIDVYRALAFVDDPFLSPCLQGGANCRDIFPDSSAFSYEPQNPFTEPDYVPDGYQAPPFSWVKPTDTGLLLLGFQVGDIYTDPTRFMNGQIPIPPGDFGFPRFRFSWTGGAEIELHFLKIPIGGRALITYDGNLLPLDVVDLNFDLTALPPETVREIVIEQTITGEGAHFLDVTFFPVLDDSIPFFGYGGGFRKVTICQGGCMSDFDVRQNEETPCVLEKTTNGDEWVQWANLRLCHPIYRARVGGGIEISDDGGETWYPPELPELPTRTGETPEENRCLASANAAEVIALGYEEVRTTYVTGAGILALATTALIIWGFFFVFPPVIAIVIPIIIAMIGMGGFSAAEFTEDDKEAVKCILYCNSTDNSGVVTFSFDAVVIDMQAHEYLPVKIAGIMLPILGEDGLNRAGATTSISEATCTCEECPDYDWCYTFDFLTSTGDFGAGLSVWGYSAEWELGVGWKARIDATRAGYNDRYSFLEITRLIGGIVNRIDVSGTMTYGSQTAYNQSGYLKNESDPLVTFTYPDVSLPMQYVGESNFTGHNLLLQIGIGYNNAGGSAGGSGVITRITLYGTGTNPFGEDNCTS